LIGRGKFAVPQIRGGKQIFPKGLREFALIFWAKEVPIALDFTLLSLRMITLES
jgi:hypothetical protein